jgi:hypothetical protein
MTSVNKKKKKSAPIKPVAEDSHEASASEVHTDLHETTETHSEEHSSEIESQASTEAEPVHIEFPYSDLVRAKIPKAFAVAEKVATDWKN